MRWVNSQRMMWNWLLAGLGAVALFACNTEIKSNDSPAVLQHQAIRSEAAPPAIGPYSQGIQVGNTLYCAGQLGMNPKTGQLVEGGITTQTRQALENLGAVLREAGMDYDHVARATVFLANMDDFPAMNEVYQTFFKSTHPPARSTVEVAKLPRGARVEIDLIAVK